MRLLVLFQRRTTVERRLANRRIEPLDKTLSRSADAIGQRSVIDRLGRSPNGVAENLGIEER